MTETGPEPLEVPVDGASLTVLSLGEWDAGGAGTVVAAHGITGSGMSFATVARHLPPGWRLLAPDLRGRGHSATAPGPYGLENHASDICAVAAHCGGRVVLAGHSMGGFVALLAAARRPELVERLVLVDGGLPLPAPTGDDLDAALDATLGPAIARLRLTFPSRRAYLDFFRQHPALGPYWNADIEAYVAYDLTGEQGAMRSRVVEGAVRVDGRQLLGDAESFGRALRGLTVPALVLTAPSGLFDEPPGFVPEDVVRRAGAYQPLLRAELVPGTNHYTILFDPRAAALVARRLTDPSSWPPSTVGDAVSR